jgi:hypothetical protein
MEPAARRKQLVDAVLVLSLRGAQLRPLVLVYEDLHWIDTSTEALLGTLLDAIAGVPLLLLLTYRVGYPPPFGSRSFHTTLTLQSLSEADTMTMASRILGTERFPEELKAVLLAKAEGVPLFVEEVVKTLLDIGALRRENGSYRVVQGLAEARVPDTVQDIIMARLDRLGEEGKRTVQLASVIGRQFLVRLPGTHRGPDGTDRGAADRAADARAHLPAGPALRTCLCVQARRDPGRSLQQPPAAAAAGITPGGGRGQVVETTSDAEEALRLAREIGDPKLLAETLLPLGRLLQWRAEFDRSLVYLHEGWNSPVICMQDSCSARLPSPRLRLHGQGRLRGRALVVSAAQ